MSADKERIAELEREVSDYALCNNLQAQSIRELSGELDEAERKLAEHQAINSSLQDFAIWLTGCGYEFTQHQYYWNNQHLLCDSNNAEELNNLIAKAKEEGRKEAVPEGWQVVPKSPTDTGAGGMVNAGAIALKQHDDTPFMENRTGVAAFVYTQMLAAAPKPQGETSCQ